MSQVLVIGLVEGTLFGLLAVGITLIHRGTGAINFALGEVGTFGLYAAWWLTVDQGLPWIVGALGAVATAVGLSLAFERFVVRPMTVRNPLAVSVATVGLLTALISFEFQRFGESPREVPVPIAGLGVRIAGVNVSPTQLLSVVVVAAIALGLGQFLRRTDFGLGVLAAAQDPDATRLVGVPLRRVTRVRVGGWGRRGGPRGALRGAVGRRPDARVREHPPVRGGAHRGGGRRPQTACRGRSSVASASASSSRGSSASSPTRRSPARSTSSTSPSAWPCSCCARTASSAASACEAHRDRRRPPPTGTSPWSSRSRTEARDEPSGARPRR